MILYHNPRCRKSRETLALLQEKGFEPTIREYLKDVPNVTELESVLNKLDMSAEQLLRKGEAVYKESYKGKSLSELEWIKAMVQHPKLIERPILIVDDKAAIGRPPTQVLNILP